MRRAFILGSGFSMAISSEMPTLDLLSMHVQSDLAAERQPAVPGAETPIARNFEQWLSYLIDTPPWLSDSDQLRNRGTYIDVAAAVHRVLTAAQLRALTSPPPEWLTQLVGYWQTTSSVVITFNYDILTELAWLTAHPERNWTELYPVPVTPAALRTGSIYGSGREGEGMRLLKLHGSLGWWYSGAGGPPGDPIFDLGVRGPWSGNVGPYAYENYLVSDKEPMIIPPAAVKSPYYGNQVIRSLWQQAASALRQTDEVVLMGFSLPPTDQLVGSMLATESQAGATIVPVNPDQSLVSRLRVLLNPIDEEGDRVIDAFCGIDLAIPRWVATYANLA